MSSVSHKFESLLEVYRRPDSRKWSGQNLHDVTGGMVSRSYVTNLRKGRIQNPGYEKLKAIARAMGFPPELWFTEDAGADHEHVAGSAGQNSNIADRLASLFETTKNSDTRKRYTDAEVSRASFDRVTSRKGGLTEEEVRGIRTGEIPNPSVSQVLALADVFGVRPSYFLDDRQPLVLDYAISRAMEDEALKAILQRSVRLTSGERAAVLSIIQQFEDSRSEPDSR